jgi:threonine dehydrogenase-like Zn-dependent dehydrogenase
MWLLHGTGFELFGNNDAPEDFSMPEYGPDEILFRHDAVGLCGADVKLIRLGQNHPRITKDLGKNPVAVGHEISGTVVGVGDNLKDRFKVGDRYIVQPDVYKDGVVYGYGFAIHGGLAQYVVLDERVLDGDAGCYLLPIRSTTGYAESAIIEALTAVVAAYRLKFRSSLKNGGTTWIVGTKHAKSASYTVSSGLSTESRPNRIVLSDVPPAFENWIKEQAEGLGIEIFYEGNIEEPSHKPVDDLVVLGADPEILEKTMPFLGMNGVLVVMDDQPLSRPIRVGMGRIHYDRWVLSGTSSTDAAQAYKNPSTRSTLKPGGRAWFVGSGGPIGRTHVQNALTIDQGPKTILCTDLSADRIDVMQKSYAQEAKEKGVEFICTTNDDPQYESKLSALGANGFDDIMVCAPSAEAIKQAYPYAGTNSTVNIFAGVAKDTYVTVDISGAWLKGVRTIGFSGSTVEDMVETLQLIEAEEFFPGRLVMAIGSIESAKEGLKAVLNAEYPGKIVIYNHIHNFPITPVNEINAILPSVGEKLLHGTEWTREAEEEFLKLMIR